MSQQDRIAAERDVIQGIAERLQREQPDKSIAELWPAAMDIFRVQFETRALRDPDGDER